MMTMKLAGQEGVKISLKVNEILSALEIFGERLMPLTGQVVVPDLICRFLAPHECKELVFEITHNCNILIFPSHIPVLTDHLTNTALVEFYTTCYVDHL